MATPVSTPVATISALLTNYTSTASLSYRNVDLPPTQSNRSRVLIFKEASEIPGPPVFSIQPTGLETILDSTILFLNSNEAVTLQATSGDADGSSSNYWAILSGYSGVSTFSTQVLPEASDVIQPSMTTSQLFVDLRTQSKTLLLPPIATFVPSASQVPIFTIKDVYGMANVHSLYISTSYNDTLERSSINNSIGITQAYASIDLAANLTQHKWHILNYYNGSLVSNP